MVGRALNSVANRTSVVSSASSSIPDRKTVKKIDKKGNYALINSSEVDDSDNQVIIDGIKRAQPKKKKGFCFRCINFFQFIKFQTGINISDSYNRLESSGTYKWMSFCGVLTFLMVAVLAMLFFCSVSQKLGTRISSITYEETEPVQDFSVPFTDVGIPTQLRFNFKKTTFLSKF